MKLKKLFNFNDKEKEWQKEQVKVDQKSKLKY